MDSSSSMDMDHSSYFPLDVPNLDETFVEHELKPEVGRDVESCEDAHDDDTQRCLACLSCVLVSEMQNPNYPLLIGAHGNSQMSQDMWAFFILQNLLGYSRQKIAEMMQKTFGVSLRSWFVLCGECRNLVQDAMEVYQKLIKITKEYEGLQRKIKEKLEKFGTNKNENEDGKIFRNISEEIRKDLIEVTEPLTNSSKDESSMHEIFLDPEDYANISDAASENFESEEDWTLDKNECFDEEKDLESEINSDTDVDWEKSRKTRKSTKRSNSRINSKKKESTNSYNPTGTSGKPKKERKNKRVIYTCDVCGLKINASLRFKYHQLIHKYYENCEKVDGKLKCKLCGDLTGGAKEIRRHTIDVHSSELGLTVYQCEICEKSYSRPQGLKEHMLKDHSKQNDDPNSTEAFQYFCHECTYATYTQSNLRKHMYTHATERPLVCDQCSATFKESRSLNSHMKMVHSSFRKVARQEFVCKYCTHSDDNTFINKSLLNRHFLDAHGDLYVYKCDYNLCGKAYMSLPSLQTHQKINHSGQEVECEFCSTKVLNKIYMSAHYKNCKKRPPEFSC